MTAHGYLQAAAGVVLGGCLCIVVSLFVGAMASRMGDHPDEAAFADAGHRAIIWTCAFGAFAVLLVVASGCTGVATCAQ